MRIDINPNETGFDVCLLDDGGEQLRRFPHPTLERARAAARVERRMLQARADFRDFAKAKQIGRNVLEDYLRLAKLMGYACIDGVQRDKRVRLAWATVVGDRWLINDKQFCKFCWKRFITVELGVARAIHRGWPVQQTKIQFD
jgi:hypothetical protein